MKKDWQIFQGQNSKGLASGPKQKKNDTFGQESKIGLYRKARHAGNIDPFYPPHWTFFCNCDEICKQMLLKTKANDKTSRMTDKRLALCFTKHELVGEESLSISIGNSSGTTHLWIAQREYGRK